MGWRSRSALLPSGAAGELRARSRRTGLRPGERCGACCGRAGLRPAEGPRHLLAAPLAADVLLRGEGGGGRLRPWLQRMDRGGGEYRCGCAGATSRFSRAVERHIAALYHTLPYSTVLYLSC